MTNEKPIWVLERKQTNINGCAVYADMSLFDKRNGYAPITADIYQAAKFNTRKIARQYHKRLPKHEQCDFRPELHIIGKGRVGAWQKIIHYISNIWRQK